MIRLFKGPLPAILARNAVAWTRDLLSKLAAGEDVTKYQLGQYNQPEVKDALLAETNSKCAYCESKFRHVTYGDIEHIIPKTLDPNLRFDWNNLTIACDVCNTNKSVAVGIVDPYAAEPQHLFDFFGPLMWAKPHSVAANLTEEKLQLNRDGLVERRMERIELLRSLVASAVSKPDDIRDAMLSRAEREVGADKPYSACGIAVLRLVKTQHGLR